MYIPSSEKGCFENQAHCQWQEATIRVEQETEFKAAIRAKNDEKNKKVRRPVLV